MTPAPDSAAAGDSGRGLTASPESGSVMVERVLSRRPCESLAEYCAADGMRGLIAARAVTAEVVVAVLEDSGLRGRGGAGSPTGLKWRTEAVVLPIVEMNAGRAEFDERQIRKQPDWSHHEMDSGTWPAHRSPPVV